MLVDKAVYISGIRYDCGDLSSTLATLRHEHRGFIWVGLKDPTDEEFEAVNHELQLHPLAVEDAVHGQVRAKWEQYDSTATVVIKTLRYLEPTSDIETGEVMVFLGDRFVFVVRRGEANPFADVRKQLEAEPKLMAKGPGAVLHAVMDAIVDNYVSVDHEVKRDLEQIETAVFSGDRNLDVNSIYRLKREVLEFRRAVDPLEEAIATLTSKTQFPFRDKELLPFFRDVSDNLKRIIDHVDSYDGLLTDILNAHLAQVGMWQNEDMRKISAWAAMAAVPTMIAGIYGMNFKFMPELEKPWGYPIVIGFMLAAAAFLYWRFKKAGWL